MSTLVFYLEGSAVLVVQGDAAHEIIHMSQRQGGTGTVAIDKATGEIDGLRQAIARVERRAARAKP